MNTETADEIDVLTCEFANKTTEAARAVFEAHRAVTALVGNSVYDVELAESAAGTDALHELEVAARALRNAERIAKWRRDLAGTLGDADAQVSRPGVTT